MFAFTLSRIEHQRKIGHLDQFWEGLRHNPRHQIAYTAMRYSIEQRTMRPRSRSCNCQSSRPRRRS